MTEPLALDAPDWGTLHQAFGTAEDVPKLIAALDAVGDGQRGEIWYGLWSMLCHQDDVHTASYAAVPYLVRWAAGRAAAERAHALHLVAAIEIGRLRGGAPTVPAPLAPAYRDALGEIPRVIADCAGEPWDDDTAQVLASALAIVKGHPRFGWAALNLEPSVVCPVCDAAHPPFGWDFDRDA